MGINISLLAKKSIEKTIKLEGGYSNHINDSGGRTSMGVTEAVARANGYEGKMSELPYEVAVEIYYNNYWKTLSLDKLDDEELAFMVFDFGINAGVSRSAKFLQEAYNICIMEDVLVVDGKIGKNTINKINSYKKQKYIKQQFEALKVWHYINITKTNKKNRSFSKGWISKRTVIGEIIK